MSQNEMIWFMSGMAMGVGFMSPHSYKGLPLILIGVILAIVAFI